MLKLQRFFCPLEKEREECIRNRQHLLRTEEPKASEFACTAPSDEDLTDTEVETTGAGALQNPGSTPVKKSMAMSGGTKVQRLCQVLATVGTVL